MFYFFIELRAKEWFDSENLYHYWRWFFILHNKPILLHKIIMKMSMTSLICKGIIYIVWSVSRDFIDIDLGSSNALKKVYVYTIFLVSIFDYNMFNFFFPCIEIYKYPRHSFYSSTSTQKNFLWSYPFYRKLFILCVKY